MMTLGNITSPDFQEGPLHHHIHTDATAITLPQALTDREAKQSSWLEIESEEQKGKGHRLRLRQRFTKAGLAGFHDYEIIELLLTLVTPQKDMKDQAKQAITRFGSLRGVLEAPVEELRKIKGIGPVNSLGIKIVQEVAREFLKEKLMDKPVFESAQAIFDYLYHSMRDLKNEIFKVFYLNNQNQILASEDLFEGTLDSSVVWTREVVVNALKNNAANLIFVHNHPSGAPDPSDSDREVTRDLVYAGRIMQIKVLDHIIIGDNRYFSFSAAGLIEQYEIEFLTLKMKGVSETRTSGLRKKFIEQKLPWEHR
jgi:DNA repair protein RadC